MVFAGATKLPYLSTFVGEVMEYRILPDALALVYAYILPGLEIAVGTMLILGLFLKASALVSILITVSFAIAKIAALIRGLDIDICGCFGPAVPMLTSQTLALDFVLIVLASQILFRRGDFLAIGPWLSRKLEEPVD